MQWKSTESQKAKKTERMAGGERIGKFRKATIKWTGRPKGKDSKISSALRHRESPRRKGGKGKSLNRLRRS
jgi:hypothetical protein